MNIIFLDVDGVLNSMPYFSSQKDKKKSSFNEISDYHVEMLSKIYNECNAKIVLTSTWRDLDDPTNDSAYKMYIYLEDTLYKYGMKIYSKTTYINDDRPLEIFQWLNDHDDVKNYVILDDDYSKDMYDKYRLGDHLVQTKFFCDNISDGGLQQKHVDLAINILKRKDT